MSEESFPVGQYGVLLPCEPDKFAEFVAGLLGAPQTIERELHVPFEIDLEDLVNLHHLIDQRISQQNSASLVQFSAKVLFDDNSSVLLSGLDDLAYYNEIRPLVSQGVHLTWVYLIDFPGREAPAKQQIDLFFETLEEAVPGHVSLPPFPPRNAFFSPSIKVTINHSARSWGVDLQSLLVNQLENFQVGESTAKKLLRENSTWVSVGVFFILIGLLSFATHELASGFDRESLRSVEDAYSMSVSDRINFILSYIAGGKSAAEIKVFLVFMGGMILSMILTFLSLTVLVDRHPGFILLTESSRKHRERILSKKRRRWVAWVFSLTVAIVIGILANWLSSLLL